MTLWFLKTGPKGTGVTNSGERKPRESDFHYSRIRKYGFLAVTLVLVYEFFKASHHGVHVSIGHDTDWEGTAFWFFDALVGGIVTFALVWIAFSFEKIEDIMAIHGSRAEELSKRFDSTGEALKQVTEGLSATQGQMQDVAQGIASGGGILKSLNSEDLWNVLKNNSKLEARFLKDLDELTRTWSDLIVSEAKNTHSVVNDKNFGLLSWDVVIDTYLNEEIKDIKHRTMATNIGLYIKLIEALVDRVLTECEGTNLKVELFATAVLLPVEYYNWREYRRNLDDGDNYVRLAGTSLAFMDSYREKMKEWLKHPNKISLKRILLIQDVPKDHHKGQFWIQLNDLSLPSITQLRLQSNLDVLCDKKNGSYEPHVFKIKEIEKFIEPEDGLIELHGEEQAYAIGLVLKGDAQYRDIGVTKQRLFSVFGAELHSASPAPQVFYLAFNSETDSPVLDNLPTVSGGSDGTKPIKCPDFLAISVNDGVTSRVVACVAARLKPNYDTMSLRLITEEQELIRLKEFMVFASSKERPLEDATKP